MKELLWLNKGSHNGFWDTAMLDDLFEGRFGDIPNFDHAVDVYVIPARAQANKVKEINSKINQSNACLVILTGDEQSVFPWDELKHPKMKIWVMDPKPQRHDGLRGIPNGYAPAIKDFRGSIEDKPIDWFFAGQGGHSKRQKMFNSLERLEGGELHVSEGFTQGLPHDEYYDKLSKSKIALCPPGPHIPDTFRLWEALEMGCVPVVDRLPSDEDYHDGFWYNLFGEEPPFIYVNSWSYVDKAIQPILSNWKERANKCMAWYQGYKRDLVRNLEADLFELL